MDDPRGAHLERFLSSLTERQELVVLLALRQMSKHCRGDRHFKARCDELMDIYSETQLSRIFKEADAKVGMIERCSSLVD